MDPSLATASRSATAAASFDKAGAERSDACPTASPSTCSQRPGRPSAQATNSSAVMRGKPGTLMPARWQHLAPRQPPSPRRPRRYPPPMLSRLSSRRRFDELSEQEVLALAISSEEDDARIYRGFAERLRAAFPATAAVFDGMAEEEDQHRARLIEAHRKRFGEVIPLIRREHVSGTHAREPVWLDPDLGLDRIRALARGMEEAAESFYVRAAQRTTDAGTRDLLGFLARAEAGHERRAEGLEGEHLTDAARAGEDAEAHRGFVLTWVQPGLAGLMDGSVSTLAPIFATAFATQDTWTTFLVGLAASVGAGISMGFTEVASDDGVISGRGAPWKRGLATGVMTTLGGLGHALPYLIPHFWTATSVAVAVVFVELWAIVWVQMRYMRTPFFRATFQVVLGGALVFAAGVLIGGG